MKKINLLFTTIFFMVLLSGSVYAAVSGPIPWNFIVPKTFPSACSDGYAISQLNRTTTCSYKGDWDTSFNLDLQGANITNIAGLNGNATIISPADASAGCTNRPIASTAAKTIVIGAGGSIQDAICENLAYFQNHRLTINVDAAAYDGVENITIPSYIAQNAYEYEGGQLRINGYNGFAKVGGIKASGVNGEANPYFQFLNVTRAHPDYSGAGMIVLMGVQQAEMQRIHFSNPTEEASYGLISYGGNVKISDSHFEGEPETAFYTKQLGNILISNITGSVDTIVFQASQGNIHSDMPPSTITAPSRYKTIAGVVFEQMNTAYAYTRATNQLAAHNIAWLPSMKYIDFVKDADSFDDTAARGWRISFDGDDELQFYRREWDGDAHLFMTMDRDTRNLVIGDGIYRHTITLTSTDGTEYACGVANGGAFSCV